MTDANTERTFAVLVEDVPGVLNRVASLFRRRSFNIVSLNVGRTHERGVSRMTIVVEADARTARLVEANLYKLVNVLAVEDITARATVARDLALIRVRAGAEERAAILQICEVFRARVVDVAPDSLVVEITGAQEKIEGLETLLAPFGITEMVQTGAIALTRGADAGAAELHGLAAYGLASGLPARSPDASESNTDEAAERAA
ncbi:MAG: acetolactate synthase small subunit [Sandaracinaceae bacterium]|nr:acetolactate synthase small subunit [Myxococcales bacterium]